MADCLVLIIVMSVWLWRHQTYFTSLATSRLCPSEGHCETVFVSERGHQASTGRRHIRTFLVLKLCHGRVKTNNMHRSQFWTNFKLRIFRKIELTKKSNSRYWSCFWSNCSNFDKSFVQMAMWSVFEWKAMVFWHMVSREPPITHSQERAYMSVTLQTKNNKTMFQYTQKPQPRGWNGYNKNYYLFQLFLRQNLLANKTLFVVWSQCSQQTKTTKNKDTKLSVVSGVVSCNDQPTSQLKILSRNLQRNQK